MVSLDSRFFTGFTHGEIQIIAKRLNDLILKSKVQNLDFPDFDYPDYANLPDSISGRFQSEQVDKIQDAIQCQEVFAIEDVARLLAPYHK